MTKKFPIQYIFAAVLLIVIASVGLYLKFANSSEKSAEAPQSMSLSGLQDQEQETSKKRTEAYATYNTAVDSLDVDLCEKISGNDALKSECSDNIYSSKATKQKDVSLCEKISDTTRKSHCSNAFIYEKAVSAGIQSDCDAISGDDSMKAACVRNTVFAKIEDAAFTGTTDSCATLTGADKEYCLGRIAKDSDIDLLQESMKTHSLDTCSKIQDSAMKSNCLDASYMSTAIEQKSADSCNKIASPERKTTCLAQISRFSDSKLLQEAMAGGDVAKCEAIVSPEIKSKCSDALYLKQALADKNISVCDRIMAANMKKQCKSSVETILSQTSK